MSDYSSNQVHEALNFTELLHSSQTCPKLLKLSWTLTIETSITMDIEVIGPKKLEPTEHLDPAV